MALVFYLSSQPVLLDVDDTLGSLGEKLFYKTAHVLFYAVLAWLWWRVLAPDRRPGWPVLLSALILSTLYGASDEFHQSFVPGRHPLLSDILIDASGALLMILLLRHSSWLRHQPDTGLDLLHQAWRSRQAKLSKANE